MHYGNLINCLIGQSFHVAVSCHVTAQSILLHKMLNNSAVSTSFGIIFSGSAHLLNSDRSMQLCIVQHVHDRAYKQSKVDRAGP